MNNQPVIIEQTYQTPINKVWQALTDNDQMKQWYFDIVAFQPQVGFEFQFEGGTEEHTYIHLCKITEVIPNKRLAYSWRYQGYEGDSLVTFELAVKDDSSTQLKVTHTGLETFPASNPDMAKENFIAGWTYIMGTSLKTFLEKEAVPEP